MLGTLNVLKSSIDAGVKRVIKASSSLVYGKVGTDAVDGYAMNVGGGQRITVNDLIAVLQEITESTSDVVYSDKQKGDAEHTLADVERSRELVG